MDLQDLYDAGSDILGEVTKAVENNDYSNLSDVIKKRVGQAGDEIKRNGYYSGSNYYRPTGNARQPQNNVQQPQNNAQQQYYQSMNRQVQMNRTYHAAPVSRTSTAVSPFLQKKVSNFSGVSRIVVGIIGVCLSGFSTLSIILAGLITGSLAGVTAISAIIFGLITGFFGFQIKSGVDFRNLISRYYKYGRAIGQREFFDYNELAMAVGEDANTIKKDIKKLLKKNVLSYAKTDTANTTVMLTNNAYNQYIQAETARKNRELEAEKNLIKEDTSDPNELKIIKEGNAYLKQIREINDRIPDTDEMSNKLYKLEEIMHRIFDKVKDDPTCEDALHKFMNYYLPTTTKLLNAYIDLGNQPVQGENIISAKKEIENAMDTINGAFENLLDSLFRDMAWDISSDISVMKTMMAQDGLTEDDKIKVPR
jgi:5-bromo-4-chloroindolyl phosphate hydrolysis protein